jgi:hypothetical protein
MIEINITSAEIAEAKKLTIEFDKQKLYNKFKCTTNYRGLLGEMVLHRWLTEQGIEHEWVEFTKQGWNQPDFIIEGYSIDLKTTTAEGLWYQQAKHDVYISAQITWDDRKLTINGWSTRELLQQASYTEGAAKSIYKNRNNPTYVLSTKYLIPMELLKLTGGK